MYTEREQRQLAEVEDDDYMPTVGVVQQSNIKRQKQLVNHAIADVCFKLEEDEDDSDSDEQSDCDIRVSRDGTIHCGTDEQTIIDDECDTDHEGTPADDKRCIGDVRFPHKEVKPIDEFQREVA